MRACRTEFRRFPFICSANHQARTTVTFVFGGLLLAYLEHFLHVILLILTTSFASYDSVILPFGAVYIFHLWS